MNDYSVAPEGWEVTGWAVAPNGEFDRALAGHRKIREGGEKYTVIYCDSEKDAKELSSKIPGSLAYAYWRMESKPSNGGPQCY